MRRLHKKSTIVSPHTVAHAADVTVVVAEVKTELVRKSIHFLIALSPGMALFNYTFTVFLLIAGVFTYMFMEILRLCGIKVPLVSNLTAMASRPRDMGVFVLGPVTLGIGAILALLLFPPPVACIGIYALAFGDGFAGLAGKLFGKLRPAFLFGKSIEGSITCFTATYISAYMFSHNNIISLAAAITATIVEALPFKDYDNIVLPLIVGLVVQMVY
jgi:dolichol kinase